MKTHITLPLITVAMLLAGSASAQYNKVAGQNAPRTEKKVDVLDEAGRVIGTQRVYVAPDQDKFGNAQGNQYDLAVDGAFKGQTVAVLHLYTGEGFNFALPRKALASKGFSVYRWSHQAPTPEDLEKALAKSCQFWLISDSRRTLTDAHVKIIKKFFDSGRGVYIWGDNQPYYTDANILAKALLDTSMKGNLMGNQVVPLRAKGKKTGILPNHLLTTGLEHLYEGITIATIEPNQHLEPLLYGSAGNLVSAFYDKGGKRAILDGGFTRLYINWDTAGTARYVKNAAAWLVNVERFGDDVVASAIRN